MKEEKIASKILDVQKYDKKLFTSKHPLYNPQRQIALSTLSIKQNPITSFNKKQNPVKCFGKILLSTSFPFVLGIMSS
jgi:hypothetical protein